MLRWERLLSSPFCDFLDIFDKLRLSLNGDNILGPVCICGDMHEVAIPAMINQG